MSALTELLKKPRMPIEWGERFNLWVHDDHVCKEDFVVNPDLFQELQVGAYAKITIPPDGIEQIYLRISSVFRGAFKQSAFQMSLHERIASQYAIKGRTDVYFSILKEKAPIAKRIVFVTKDRFFDRFSMWEATELLQTFDHIYKGMQINLSETNCVISIDKIFDENDNVFLRENFKQIGRAHV